MHKQVKSTVASLYIDHGTILTAHATIAAYTEGEAWLNDLLVYLENTIYWIHNYFEKELPEVTMINPEGTSQIWLDFSKLNLSEAALKYLVFKQAKLGLAPGDWFKTKGPQFMRMNIATPLSKIQQSFYQLKEAIDNGLDSAFNEAEHSNNLGFLLFLKKNVLNNLINRREVQIV